MFNAKAQREKKGRKDQQVQGPRALSIPFLYLFASSSLPLTLRLCVELLIHAFAVRSLRNIAAEDCFQNQEIETP
ncbi:MAG: hypothetical protein NTW01_15685 [Gammaproteobacteria bacterium]|nr:hypothetical protein [Gammaproteobacteria bacterium]